MLGSAMFTIVASSTTMSCAVQITTSASAKFFGEQVLPTTAGLLAAVTSPADDLYALTADQLR